MEKSDQPVPRPQALRPPAATAWTETERESVLLEWVRLLQVLVRYYSRSVDPGLRQKMWQRVPTTCATKAKQAATLDDWYTATLKALQITRQGSAQDDSSLCSTWLSVRSSLRVRADRPARAERRALDLLTREIATITAFAQEAHEQWKQLHPAAAPGAVRPAAGLSRSVGVPEAELTPEQCAALADLAGLRAEFGELMTDDEEDERDE